MKRQPEPAISLSTIPHNVPGTTTQRDNGQRKPAASVSQIFIPRPQQVIRQTAASTRDLV